ncbi:MAG: hypothetical protein ACO1RX_04500 [Candidatus Sericytochromatia bacterium]
MSDAVGEWITKGIFLTVLAFVGAFLVVLISQARTGQLMRKHGGPLKRSEDRLGFDYSVILALFLAAVLLLIAVQILVA